MKKVILSFLITVLLLTGLIMFGGYSKIIDKLTSINLFLYGLAFISWTILNMILAIRIKHLLEYLGHRISYVDSFLTHMTGMLISDFTPARVGYFIVPILLKKDHKIPINKGVLITLGPQMFEFIWKIMISYLLLFLIMDKLDVNQLWMFIVAGIIGIVSLLFVVYLLLSERGIKKFSFVKKIPLLDRIYDLFYKMQKNGHVLINEWRFIILTLIGAWLFKALEWVLIAWSLNIHLFDNLVIEFVFYGSFQSFISFLNFIPIPTLAGTGFSEGIAAGVLTLLGVPLPTAVLFSILARFDSVVIDVIFGIPKLEELRLKEISKVIR